MSYEDRYLRYERQIEEIEEVISEYYDALRRNTNAAIAREQALMEIEKIIGRKDHDGSPVAD